MVNNELMPDIYASLAGLCKDYDIGYSSATHGKTVFWKEGVKYELKKLTLIKITGKGNANNFRGRQY